MSELLKCVRTYRSLDDKLKVLNKEVHGLREERKIAEIEMSDILKSVDYATIHKLEIKDDRTVIKIQRPDMWSKPWSLSARELKSLLESYWVTPGVHSAEGCYNYIVDKRKNDLVARDFSFTRYSNKADNNDVIWRVD